VIVDGPFPRNSVDLKQDWNDNNFIEGITSAIWEGTKVLKRISENIKEINFDRFSLSDEKKTVSRLREQFLNFSSKFAHSKDLFDGMYLDFQTQHLQQKSILESKKRELANVSHDLDEIEREIISMEKLNKTIGYDLNQAIVSRDDASRRADAARKNLESANESAEKAETICEATALIPFVGLGTCLNYDAKLTDAHNAYYKMKSEYERAERKVKTVENFLTEYNNLKTKLNTKLNSKSIFETNHTILKLKINRQALFLQELGVLQEKLQLLKTEVDIIQARLQSIQGKY